MRMHFLAAVNLSLVPSCNFAIFLPDAPVGVRSLEKEAEGQAGGKFGPLLTALGDPLGAAVAGIRKRPPYGQRGHVPVA